MDWKTAVAAFLGAILSAAGTAIYHHLFGVKRVTEETCEKRHAADEAKCVACKKDTEKQICGVNHDISSIKSLLMLIAIELKVPADKLQQLVKQ